MVNRNIGSRAVRAKRPVVSKLTVQDLDQLRSEGHTVVELPGGQVEIGGNRFKVLGQRRQIDPGSVSLTDASEAVHSDIGDFSITTESNRVHGDF